MALNEIIDKIKEDSAVQAETIRAEARTQADERLRQAKKRAAQLADKRRLWAERSAETVRARTLARARLAARDAVLAAKQDAVEEVFAKGAAALESLDGGTYADLLERVLVARAEGDVEVVSAVTDAPVVSQALVDRAAASLAGKATLRLGVPTDEIARGFVLRSGRILVDCSLATLLSEARQRLETDVYGRLFGESVEV